MNVPCPYCNRGCAECHDGNAPCVHCDLPAAGVLDDDPMCQSHLDEYACGTCGERHATEDHLPIAQGW